MSLSHLDSYTAEEWKNLGIVPFANQPKKTADGNPDPNVTIEPAGWVGTHLFAFRLTTAANNDSSLTIDGNAAAQVDVSLVKSQAPQAFISFWTVETDQGNGKDDEWSLAFEVEKDKKKTGKWIFTKSKDDDDKPQDRKGCLGVFAALLP